jgi:hypothetical protein
MARPDLKTVPSPLQRFKVQDLIEDLTADDAWVKDTVTSVPSSRFDVEVWVTEVVKPEN